MKLVIAIDSFKGSLSSLEAGKAVQEAAEQLGILDSCVLPVADGGEGTMQTLTKSMHGEFVECTVMGPLGEPVRATYGWVSDRKLAIMEMAQAAGLPLVPVEQRDPTRTTTYGVGEMILHAYAQGGREFLIGIGGSATNDGGLGMLTALGVKFLDQKGKPVGIYGRDLLKIDRIDLGGLHAGLRECRFRVACDVTNPLCGENGASAVFGPQKGATPEMVESLDQGLRILARGNESLMCEPGAGAAGGLGFAFRAFLHGELKPGIETVLVTLQAEQMIRDASLIVTGEGRLDAQTAMGKVPAGLARIAKRYHVPVVAFGGCLEDDAAICNTLGIDAYFSILRSPMPLAKAMEYETAYHNLKYTAEQVFRLFLLTGRTLK